MNSNKPATLRVFTQFGGPNGHDHSVEDAAIVGQAFPPAAPKGPKSWQAEAPNVT
jgi:hypothetical protein